MRYFYPSLFEMHPSAKTFLDLGCGQGLISLYAAARGLQADAVDIDTGTPAPLQGIQAVSYVAADLKNWEPSKKYDIIIAHHSIQFLPKVYVLQQFLPALCSALNPGGLLEIFSFTPKETLSVPTKYSLEEVVSSIGGLEIIKQEAFSYDGMHRKLGPHTFHELHVIGRKSA
jgi:trans-aconitate methyltransferase